MARIELIVFVTCVSVFVNVVKAPTGSPNGDQQAASSATPATMSAGEEVPDGAVRNVAIKGESTLNKLSRAATLRRSLSEKILLKNELNNIDLDTLQPKTVPYYKNVLLLYTGILDTHFFSERPSYSSLRDLEKFPETGSETDLLIIGNSVMIEYDKNVITKDDYLKKALYFKALSWVQAQTDNKEPILGMTNSILSNFTKKGKARNYLSEMLNYDKKSKWFNFADKKFKKLGGWEEDDENDQALKFCEQIAPLRGNNASNVELLVTDLNVYERIFADANEGVCKSIFGVEPYEMLRILDYAFNLIHQKRQLPGAEEFILQPALSENIINLSELSNGKMDVHKHASVLFAAAFREKFELNFITKRTNQDIRYLSFIRLACNLPKEMNDIIQTMDEIGGLFSFSNKAYLYWLVGWYRSHVIDEQYDAHKEISQCLDSLLQSTQTTNIMDVLYKEGKSNAIMKRRNSVTNKLSELLNLGEDINNVLSSIMAVTLDELLNKFNEGRAEWYELTFDNKSTSDCDKKLETYENAINNVLKFGLPEFQTYSESNYVSVIRHINEDKFEEEFLIPLSTIKLKMETRVEDEKKGRHAVRRLSSTGRYTNG